MKKAQTTQANIRAANQRDVLQAIIDGRGRESRAGIARITGLTSATVSAIVSDLIEDQFVVEGDFSRKTGGKPAIALEINRNGHCVAALIVDPHTVRGAILDLSGEVRTTVERHFDDTVGIADITQTYRALVDAARSNILATAVQIPGVVDGGWIRECVQLGLQNEDLASPLVSVSPAPIYLINDANAQAMAEFSLLPPGSQDSLLFVSMSTGFGIAIVVDGRLLLGSNNRAGEVAHVPIVTGPSAERCSCGNWGCLETVGALPALLKLPFNADLSTVNFAEQSARPEVRAHWSATAPDLVRGIALISAAVDAPNVVLGGWASSMGSDFLAMVRDLAAKRHAVGSSPLRVDYARADDRSEFWAVGRHAVLEKLAIGWGSLP